MRAICIMLGTIPDMVTAGKIKDETLLKKVRPHTRTRARAHPHTEARLSVLHKARKTQNACVVRAHRYVRTAGP